jgi:hypothetical protein
MKRFKLEFKFEVLDDDMPSERGLEYRQAIIDAMAYYKEQIEMAADELGTRLDEDALKNAKLIDKMLEDCHR